MREIYISILENIAKYENWALAGARQMMGHSPGRGRAILFLAALFLTAMPAHAQRAIDLPGKRLFPESVSITPEGTAYIGSMSGGVVRVMMRTGRVRMWIQPGAYGSGALFGVLADQRNGLLWTCTNEFPGTGVTVAGSQPGHWLKGFDLRTGKGRVSLQLPGDKPICNDMAVGKDGAVFVTDTGNSRVLRWRPGAEALEIWLESPLLGAGPGKGGLDGIAFGADGSLYLNNLYSGAIYRVDVQADGTAGAITSLALSRPLVLPDGMKPLSDGAFLVAEGGGRISRLAVSGDTVDVTTLAEGMANPTGIDVHDGKAWYVQAQLSALFAPGKVPPPELPFRLTSIAVPR
jgi:sugar lactone lactonase YvrE